MAYYPFNGKDEESEIILYEDKHFLVSFGFDKTEKHYRVGLMWKEVKNECQVYPISGKMESHNGFVSAII